MVGRLLLIVVVFDSPLSRPRSILLFPDDALLEVPGMMYEESRANLLAMRDRELSLPALSSVRLFFPVFFSFLFSFFPNNVY